jgi:hypothetical protein
MTCKHEYTYWTQSPVNGSELRCQDCGLVLAWECDDCYGECVVFEDDWHGDYVNCGHDLMPCPKCGGSGVVWADENTRQQIQTRWKAEQE